MICYNMEQNFNLYSKNEIAKFEDSYYNISIYEYKLPTDNKTKVQNSFGLINNLVRYDNITSPNR